MFLASVLKIILKKSIPKTLQSMVKIGLAFF